MRLDRERSASEDEGTPAGVGCKREESSRRSHPTYPEYLDLRRVPLPLEEQKRAQVRSPSPEAQGARSCEGGGCHAAREVHY